MRRSIVWLGLLLAAALALAACGAVEEEENSEEMTTLVYAILSEEGVDRQAIYRFNTKNKRNRVRIEVEEYFDEDGRSGKDRLLTEMASGKSPTSSTWAAASTACPTSSWSAGAFWRTCGRTSAATRHWATGSSGRLRCGLRR